MFDSIFCTFDLKINRFRYNTNFQWYNFRATKTKIYIYIYFIKYLATLALFRPVPSSFLHLSIKFLYFARKSLNPCIRQLRPVFLPSILTRWGPADHLSLLQIFLASESNCRISVDFAPILPHSHFFARRFKKFVSETWKGSFLTKFLTQKVFWSGLQNFFLQKMSTNINLSYLSTFLSELLQKFEKKILNFSTHRIFQKTLYSIWISYSSAPNCHFPCKFQQRVLQSLLPNFFQTPFFLYKSLSLDSLSVSLWARV